jgi:hypothetical protein
MKINKVITAVNDNPVYRDFIPLTSIIWKKLFNLELIIGYVTDRPLDDPMVKSLSAYGDLRIFPRLSDIDSGIQAKVTRMYLASLSEFVNENCMIVDIDMIPLSNEVLSVFEEVPEQMLVRWGYDHPAFRQGGPDFGKWPMDRTTAVGSIFKEIINPNELNYTSLINSWVGYHLYGREDVSLPFNQFSDESLLRALHDQWPAKEKHTYNLPRARLENILLERRLDRSQPSQWVDLPLKLERQQYIEMHGIRPLNTNLNYYSDMLNYYNLKDVDVIL